MRVSMSLVVILGLIAAASAQVSGSLDGMIDSVPGNIPTTDTSGTGTSGTIGNSAGAGNNDNCECVPHYQCQNNTINTKGIGIINMRSGGSNLTELSQTHGSDSIRLKGACVNDLHVCCKPTDVLKPEKNITLKSSVRTRCGQRNLLSHNRLTGLNIHGANFGEFSWMVAITRKEEIGTHAEKLNNYLCGGSLIHEQAVLTAAHCVNGKQPSQLNIRAGDWDLHTTSESRPHQDRDVEAVIVHEKFHSGALHNDIAILLLKTPVDLAEHVGIVCLPEYNEVHDGSRCLASGWGKYTFDEERRYQPILKREPLSIVPSPVCQSSLRETRLGKYFVLDQSFICAGGEAGKDTCTGDGGSPLVCPLKNDSSRYAQVGIVSWGIGCGEGRVPAVYANVAQFRYWIDDKMAFHNLDTTVYRA